MRVLIASTPVTTHFTPMVPLALALRAAGHEVLVLGQPEIADAANGAGLSAIPVGDRFHALELLRGGLPEGVRPIQAGTGDRVAELTSAAQVWRNHASHLLHDYLDVAASWRPDLMVSERMEFTGPVIAAVRGIPVVRHRWGVDPWDGRPLKFAGAFLEPACQRLGLPGYPEDTVLLDPCPPELQVPGAAPGLPIRPTSFNGAGELPDWALEPGSARRVCVCLGRQTLALNGIGLLRAIVAAFDGLSDVEAVITAEPEHQRELGDLPENVRFVDPTPLDLILGSCAAVVHHGGANTNMAATVFGLPQLVLPQIQDQFAAAERVAATGAGLAVETAGRQDDPAVLRENLRALLDDPRHVEAAAGLRLSTTKMPAPAEVVTDLEKLVLR